MTHDARPLDFSVKPTDTMPGGLTMVLKAGNYADCAAGRPMAWCFEEAFGFVEPVIGACWPAYRNYGHWGVNEIPVDDWRAIVAKMRERKSALLAARTPREAHDLVIFLYSKAQFAACRVITLCGV